MSDIIQSICNAWGSSTPNSNDFGQVLSSICWDCTYYAENEHYFIKGDLTFVTEHLNPFSQFKGRPCFLGDKQLSDTGILYI